MHVATIQRSEPNGIVRDDSSVSQAPFLERNSAVNTCHIFNFMYHWDILGIVLRKHTTNHIVAEGSDSTTLLLSKLQPSLLHSPSDSRKLQLQIAFRHGTLAQTPWRAPRCLTIQATNPYPPCSVPTVALIVPSFRAQRMPEMQIRDGLQSWRRK
jgi:hypothetical protein